MAMGRFPEMPQIPNFDHRWNDDFSRTWSTEYNAKARRSTSLDPKEKFVKMQQVGQQVRFIACKLGETIALSSDTICGLAEIFNAGSSPAWRSSFR